MESPKTVYPTTSHLQYGRTDNVLYTRYQDGEWSVHKVYSSARQAKRAIISFGAHKDNQRG